MRERACQEVFLILTATRYHFDFLKILNKDKEETSSV